MTEPLCTARDCAPIRVCHIIHSLGAGGAETVLASLAGAVRRVGVETLVIGLSDAEDARAVPPLLLNGAVVHQLHRGRYDVRAVLDVIRLLKREKVDVVHTHLKHADVIGGAAAKLLAIPAVSTLHVIEAQPHDLWHLVRLQLATAVRSRLFARIITVSSAQGRWYQRRARDKQVIRVPNGVEEPRVVRPGAEVRTALGLRSNELLALTVSLMRPEKGHLVLLEAVRKIDPGLPIQFVFAGDGHLLAQLARTVADDELLSPRVHFLGFRNDIDDLLAAADLVVHPSSEDALPTALIQALAAGRPIVATSVGGVPDIVDEDSGLLVAPNDPDALAASIVALAKDPSRRNACGKLARLRYERYFAADVWACRMRDIYDEVRGGPPGTATNC